MRWRVHQELLSLIKQKDKTKEWFNWVPSKSKVSTDLSLCKWTRAHFADTEGLLLGVSTINTHHSAAESKQNRLKHQAAVGDYNTDRPRAVLNSVSESLFSTCHSSEWQHIVPEDPRSPLAHSSCDHSRCTASVLNTKTVATNVIKAELKQNFLRNLTGRCKFALLQCLTRIFIEIWA